MNPHLLIALLCSISWGIVGTTHSLTSSVANGYSDDDTLVLSGVVSTPVYTDKKIVIEDYTVIEAPVTSLKEVCLMRLAIPNATDCHTT